MKHWYLKDTEGNIIGHLDLKDDSEVPNQITSGHKFKLEAEYLDGSDSPRHFILVPE